MLKKLIFVLCTAIVGISCLKSDEQRTCDYPVVTKTAPKAEQDSLKMWLDSNGIAADKHPTGFYYKIITAGDKSDTMTLCSELLINYTGNFQDGSLFDTRNQEYLLLGASIEGWKKGIPLIGKGGEIKLYIPPSLGYGSKDYPENGPVAVPGNSTLIFSVKLIDYYTPGY